MQVLQVYFAGQNSLILIQFFTSYIEMLLVLMYYLLTILIEFLDLVAVFICCCILQAGMAVVSFITWKTDMLVLGDVDGNLNLWDLKAKVSRYR